MSKHQKTTEEIIYLSSNKNILSSTSKYITYIPDFINQVLSLKKEGLSTKQIFIDSDLEILSHDKTYLKDLVKGWKHKEKLGKLFLKKGRPRKENIDNSNLELRIAYLEKENTFLRELRAKRAEK